MDFVRPVEAVIPGAQGRILAVLVETTAPLNLRTLARLAGVSPAQASRVMPGLVHLGLVERYEVPPSSQFLLARTNVAAQAVIELARARETAADRIGLAAASMAHPPESVIVFGSFARGEADVDSDIDIIVVRPDSIDEDDDEWVNDLEAWRDQARSITGNSIEIIELSLSEASSKLRGRTEFWRNVRRDGIHVYGLSLDQIAEAVRA
ncbi:MAG: nucleotidyltransferase domain-containing protein [Ilumatobacter sp.]|uniref:nucleotidyltransferase domain-containing protein n=1 Tax=Ilumatobacter sp. TaxID=1967498 RepID=UPI00391D0AF5